MSKLQDLIKSLMAYSILIIEDEITYIDDPLKLLIRFCKADNWVKEAIIEDLKTINFNTLSEAIEDFNTEFTPLLSNKEEVENFLTGGYLDRFLKKLGKEELLENKVFEEFNAALKKDTETESIKAIFTKYGIYLSINDAHYGQLLSELNGIEGVQILYYKQTPGSNKDSFYADILKSVERTSSNFCLAIIDKSLSTGSANEVGKEFIIDDLVGAYKDNSELRFIACLYTSRPDPDEKELIKYEDFFIEEITKGSDQVIDKMTKSLAQSAFAEVFNSLRNKKLESAQEAFDLVLKNQKNIKFIIDESHKEGIPPYDAVKYWFDLAKQERFDKKELEDYKFIAGLTAFFKQEYLDDHPNISEIGEELRSLNTYELYDYNVNKRHLPIAPGDIWESNGEYYILMGQLCDLLLRKEKTVDGEKIPNQRNAKVGELIKIKAVDNSEGKKYSINSKENKKLVFIEHFIDFLDNDKIKALQIDISTPFIHFADLQVLDLSMFNDNGICELSVGEELDGKIKLVLSERKDEYYDSLKEYYSEDRLKNIKLLAGKLGFNEPLNFSKLKFEESEGKINHGIRRVCRLKGRYYDSLYNNYLNTKGRIDLNLIDNSPEIVTKTKVKYQLANDETTVKEVEINKYENRGGKYFVTTEILEAFGEPYVSLLDTYKKNTIDITENGLLKITEEGEEILIQFCYQTINKKPIAIDKTDFGYLEIFQGQRNRYENKTYIIDGGNGGQKIFNNDSRITINELKTGITINELNERIRIINGIITKENIEE